MKNEIDIPETEFKRQVAHSGLIPEGNIKSIKHLFSEYKKYKDDITFNEHYNLNPPYYKDNSNPPNYQYYSNPPNLNIIMNNFIKNDVIMDLYYKLYNKGYVSNIKEIKSEEGEIVLKQFIINHKFGQNKYDNWIPAWHGTKFIFIESIIIKGLKSGGIKLNGGTLFTMEKAIFSSDNIFLELQYSDEINVNENNYLINEKDKTEYFSQEKDIKENFTYSEKWKGLVKVKIKPNSFSKHKSRIYDMNKDTYIDGNIYRTISEKDIVITSVVFIKLSYIMDNKNKLDSIIWELNENNKEYNNKSLLKNSINNEYNNYNNTFTSNLKDKESIFDNLNINELFENDSYKYNEYNNKSFVCNSNTSSLNEDYINLKNKFKKSHSKILNKSASYYSINDSINYLKDSMIIKDKNDAKMIKNWISPYNNISFKLLYRATRDGDSHDNFYSKCNEAPNIAFIKINDGRIIGGYTTVPWKSENNSFISDKEAFIFSINSKEKYNLKSKLNGNNAIYHNLKYYCCCYGYCGDDLAVSENFLNKNTSYCCGNGDKYLSFDTNNFKMIGKNTNGKIYFTISELEVYKICYNNDNFSILNSTEINFSTIPNFEKKIINQITIDSRIIKDENIVKMIKHWIQPDFEVNLKLIYRATRDGDSATNFHKKCDNKSPTITIIKTEKGRIIGGYTTIPWIKEDNYYIEDKNAFIFSIDSKEKYDIKSQLGKYYAVYHSNSYYCSCFGFCGDDLAVGNNFLEGKNSYCCGNGDTYYTFETDNNKMLGSNDKGKIMFKIDELEMYKIN